MLLVTVHGSVNTGYIIVINIKIQSFSFWIRIFGSHSNRAVELPFSIFSPNGIKWRIKISSGQASQFPGARATPFRAYARPLLLPGLLPNTAQSHVKTTRLPTRAEHGSSRALKNLGQRTWSNGSAEDLPGGHSLFCSFCPNQRSLQCPFFFHV